MLLPTELSLRPLNPEHKPSASPKSPSSILKGSEKAGNLWSHSTLHRASFCTTNNKSFLSKSAAQKFLLFYIQQREVVWFWIRYSLGKLILPRGNFFFFEMRRSTVSLCQMLGVSSIIGNFQRCSHILQCISELPTLMNCLLRSRYMSFWISVNMKSVYHFLTPQLLGLEHRTKLFGAMGFKILRIV